ncbi:sushi, von Willebrand factor type A, EGF and pentraxin domain-containing protein 1-like [Mytilus trossulus]|uniref:sushi, von Willebrand factor type A, EGF and pentraxin domain-containing protein 1-like n=1 Tax=Mytilus trossulus TaxID=6551 RepID=UPI0030069CFE
MRSLLRVYFLLLIGCVEAVGGTHQVGCDVRDVPALTVDYCEVIGHDQDSSKQELQSTVDHGTICVFRNQNSKVKVTKQCNIHGWHDTDSNNAGSRDRTKPHIDCPFVEPKSADPMQTTTIMTWTEPVAHDNKDGTITPRRAGPGPHSLFGEVTTLVNYTAIDRAGNFKTCSVKVVVKVVRCPPLSPVSDGYYMCHPSNDMVQGTHCQFGCYRGHYLVGNSSIECDGKTRKWYPQQPKCDRLQCQSIGAVARPLHFNCTDYNYYRSICTFSCEPGYDITPGQTRVMLCTEDGTWRGSQPVCKDAVPPSFTMCNGYQIGFADRGLDDGIMTTFQLPTVKDNIDQNPILKMLSRTDPSKRLKAGVHDMLYSAEDKAGNKAVNCRIKVVMKVITCPRIYPIADTLVTCDSGSRFGSNCNFSCENAATLNKTDPVTCQRQNAKSYGHWSWDDKQPYCVDAKRCRDDLKAPENGALACDYWLGGKFCHMFCRSRYDVPVGHIDGNEMFVCGQSGKWMPSSSVPNCARVIGSRSSKYRLNIDFHYTGNCHDQDVVLKIQQTFIEHWKTDVHKEGCLNDIDKCIPSNIQVLCGSLTGKRSTRLTISFDVQMESSSDIGSQQFTNISYHQYSVVQKIKKAIHNAEFNFALDNNSTVNATDFTYTLLEVDCPDNTVQTNNHNNCAKCPPGTYYKKNPKSCATCPRGTFQPMEGQPSCIKCPTGKTTPTEGSTSRATCEDACLPGSWSMDGIPPCSYCPKGTYQDSYGGIDCQICPRSLTTDLDGAESFKHCQEFDIHFNSPNVSVERKFEAVSSSSVFVSTWMRIEKYQHENCILAIHVDGYNHTNIFVRADTVQISHNGFELSASHKLSPSKWYFLTIMMSDKHTVLTFDEESLELNHSSLLKQQTGNIQLGGGIEGRISQLNIYSKPVKFVKAQKCFGSMTGDILSWKEFEDVLQDDIYVHIPSDCDDTNECDSNPCLNGDCTDELNGYSCQCFYGFYGDNCEHNIDDCGYNACDNNGTCIDGPASYTCQCSVDYTGSLCEIMIVDGEWSEWGNWSTCSVSCDNGTITRTRLCNSPTPDHGGKTCLGNSTEYDICEEETCRVCKQLVEQENTVLSCHNNTAIDTINCTLNCQPGFAFDHDPKDYYFCGPETLHEWDFQTNDNPLARLPSCTEINNASQLIIDYTARYSDLICDLSVKADAAENKIKEVLRVASDKIDCIGNGLCKIIRLEVINCTDYRLGKKDTLSDKAAFNISFWCDSHSYGSDECYTVLLDAFNSMVNQTRERRLDSEVDNTIYPIDPQSLNVDSKVICESGMVSIDFRCVSCSKGRFESKGNCELCGVGYYQYEIGRTYCKTCPDGKTTLGKGSTNINDCSGICNFRVAII